MFERPTKTLQQSLLNVLENAQEYVADIYFDYPTKVWAHKAILLARVPKEFREKHMHELLTCSTLDLSSLIPYSSIQHLLQFWYTADISVKGRQEIEQLECKLGQELLSKATNDKEQWISDLKRMIDKKLCSDVVLNIFQVKKPESNIEFPAHRFILAGQSEYFHSVFCTEFREASTSSVHLPSDLFTPESLQVILHYFYTDNLILPALNRSQLEEKKEHLRILQKVYSAADYLGHSNTICKAVLVKMQQICHEFTCDCPECATIIPFMLFFANRHQQTELREHLNGLYAHPIQYKLWSQRSLKVLITKAPEIVEPISKRALANITQENAVDVLYSLHLCLSSLRSADPAHTWSIVIVEVLKPLLDFIIDMIANHFNYYCVENPVLLKCVDNLGEGFSVDFLEFVLAKITNKGLSEKNAVIIYQGIVRDIGGRQKAVKNVAVDGVLAGSRADCAQYIGQRWTLIKAENGYQSIDRDILKELSEDINVPLRNLTKPVDNDFTNIFSFKPKKTKQELPVSVKRLSIQEMEVKRPRETRPRSLSATQSILKKSQEKDMPFQKKRQGSQSSLTEALLLSEDAQISAPPRQSRLRFSLPDTPSRPHRPTMQQQQQKAKAKAPKNKIKWSLGYPASEGSDDEGPSVIVPEIGQKVELLRRPLPTLGTIKYIGKVDFSNGTLVGIELESRVGNNDGSVDGKRYFQTFPQRGVFVKLDDFKIISADKK
ncbi:hypothetical protein CU098_013373 [Rhizopus stolonifer]|uniref:BTB domain-containing protein n=1 Tax=Rhizopus stolonifer TaxID=4846 RepID=A0A367KUB2_RHIST|nr:hypothetical protein CU098_013373 [Rhizopus stolonifer]